MSNNCSINWIDVLWVYMDVSVLYGMCMCNWITSGMILVLC